VAERDVFIDGVNPEDLALSDAMSRALPFAVGETLVSCRATGRGTGRSEWNLSH
jgi:hypothetical protein